MNCAGYCLARFFRIFPDANRGKHAYREQPQIKGVFREKFLWDLDFAAKVFDLTRGLCAYGLAALECIYGVRCQMI